MAPKDTALERGFEENERTVRRTAEDEPQTSLEPVKKASHPARKFGLDQVYPDPNDTSEISDEEKIDIIAIHGLNARSPKTWLAWIDGVESRGEVHWLRDHHMLPAFIPDSRIMTYDWNANDHESASGSKGFLDHADTLLLDVHLDRKATNRLDVPIIFIASCFGGLLLAKALVRAKDHPEGREILRLTVGVAFLGTPFGGSWDNGRERAQDRIKREEEKKGHFTRVFAQYMELGPANNPTPLNELVQTFSELIADDNYRFEMECFFEDLRTKTAAIWPQEERLDREGHTMTVTKKSACINGTGIGLDVRHNMLHKHWDPKSSTFLKLSSRLKEFVERADEVLQRKDASMSRSKHLSNCIKSLSFKFMDSRRYQVDLACSDTCQWLFETLPFKQWKDRTDLESNNGILWIKGHPGVGKSTLTKHAFRYCTKEFDSNRIASFFFNARGDALQKSQLGMLRALLVQLLEGGNLALADQVIPSFLKKKARHGEAEWEWETGELKEFLLQHYTQRQPKGALLFIDALDECNDSDMQGVLNFLRSLAEKAIESDSTLRICLASRHYRIPMNLEKKLDLVVEKQPEHDNDIRKYIKLELKPTTADIQKQIFEKSHHIFLWVVVVIRLLNDEFQPSEWGKILNDLPNDLDALFSAILNKKRPEKDKKTTVLIFQWVLFSKTRLKPEELYFAVIAGTSPHTLCPWDRSQLTMDNIESFISNASRGLLEIVDGRELKIQTVQFIHQSVSYFLTRDQHQVLRGLDPTLSPSVIGASHDRLACCCKVYIMQRGLISLVTTKFTEGDSRRASILIEDLEAFPFGAYASGTLFTHSNEAQAKGIPQNSLLQQLVKHDKFELFQVWQEIQKTLSHMPVGSQPLYELARDGYYDLVKVLITELGADVNAQAGYYGTALIAAVLFNHKDIVRLLLQHGARVNAEGGLFGSALIGAAHSGHTELARLLLLEGADVNARDSTGRSARDRAETGGNADIVKLLDSWANPSLGKAMRYGGFGFSRVGQDFSKPDKGRWNWNCN